MRSTVTTLVTSAVLATAALALSEREARANSGEALARIAGTQVGVGTERIGGTDPLPARAAIGGYARFDIHVVSLFVPQPHFEENDERPSGIAVYDALFAEFLFGKMTSDPAGSGTTQEGTSAVGVGWGYQALVGWRTPFFGALGGLRYGAKMTSVGGTSVDYTSALGLQARGELKLYGEAPFSADLWFKPFGDTKSFGLEAHVPLAKRFWLYGRYDYLTGSSGSLAEPSAPPVATGLSTTTLSFGLGFGRWG